MEISEQPNKVSINNELTDIRATLMTDEFSQLDPLRVILRKMREMLEESHPSGYPDPGNLRSVASYLRDEKFKIQREAGNNAPLAVSLQQLITRLENLRVSAERVRPAPPAPFDDSFLRFIAFLLIIMAITYFLTPLHYSA
ncbi:hypothetical protein [Klebsiella michiganensis]|uniref:hypothetical protein n=1 Tax=Klebsiella michiganensis TaxID=1134687 RepID=UPI003F4FD3B5